MNININVTSRLADTGSEMTRSRVAQAGAATQGGGVQVKASETVMSEVTASLVYRPSQNEVPADNTYGPLEVWVNPGAVPSGRQLLADSENMRQIATTVAETLSSLNGVYKKFKQSLQSAAPDLAKLDFGFTLDPKGELVATGVSGDQKSRLTELLKKSPELKELATQFAQNVKDYGQAEGYYRQSLGTFRLDAETFQQTIDIGKAIQTHENRSDYSNHWKIQFQRNGIIDLEKKEAMKAYRIS